MMTVWVTTDFVTHHKWEDAPDAVDFLREPHRHVFKVKVAIEVKHNNRDIEFIKFKRELTFFCQKNWPERREEYYNFVTDDSCEAMCAKIVNGYYLTYNLVEVTVSEDGENGATWHRD